MQSLHVEQLRSVFRKYAKNLMHSGSRSRLSRTGCTLGRTCATGIRTNIKRLIKNAKIKSTLNSNTGCISAIEKEIQLKSLHNLFIAQCYCYCYTFHKFSF